jgi:hypothetical protein
MELTPVSISDSSLQRSSIPVAGTVGHDPSQFWERPASHGLEVVSSGYYLGLVLVVVFLICLLIRLVIPLAVLGFVACDKDIHASYCSRQGPTPFGTKITRVYRRGVGISGCTRTLVGAQNQQRFNKATRNAPAKLAIRRSPQLGVFRLGLL